MDASDFRPPLKTASAALRTAHVFIRDLELEAVIGVHRHEKRRAQPIRVNIDLTVRAASKPLRDSLAQVVDYEQVANAVRALVAEGHMRLVETLADRSAQHCLGDRRVLAARVRVEKLAAVPGAASVGVEIERLQTPSSPATGPT